MLTPHLLGLFMAEKYLADMWIGNVPTINWSDKIWQGYILAYDSWIDLQVLGDWHNVTLREMEFA